MSNRQTVILRTPQLDDAAEIARLSTELGYPVTADGIAARLLLLADTERYFVRVASSQSGALSGWVVAERRVLLEGGTQFEITGLVVDAGARRGGVGRQLVAAAEQWSRARGAASVWVRSNSQRRESHPFYEKLGYRRRKTQHVYEKRLDDAADSGRQPTPGQ